jgi:hypothetical protein
MRTAAVVTMAIVASTRVQAGGMAPEALPGTVVCTEGETDSRQDQARMIAAQIFKSNSIPVEFRSGARSCPGDTIRIKYTGNTPPDLRPGTWAWAKPYEGVHIQVFYDSVRNLKDAQSVPTVLHTSWSTRSRISCRQPPGIPVAAS